MNRLLKIAAFFFLLQTTSFCTSKKEAAAGPTAHSAPPAQPSVAQPSVDPTPVGLNLGNLAPEIALKNPSGAVIPLSSLKGKVVLIDFWASWCGPCRAENPTVVKAYTYYKQKKLKGGNGFTIYSVSLDMDVNAWKRAIEKDSLVWENHVSDLKGWGNEAAAKYSVTGIPTNFLINAEGIIIDKNLRGEALLKALDKLSLL